MANKEKLTLSIAEQIDRYRDGRTQRWIIEKMNQNGAQLTDVTFSNKKKSGTFTPQELQQLSEILGVQISQ